jgi:hypothetical protein
LGVGQEGRAAVSDLDSAIRARLDDPDDQFDDEDTAEEWWDEEAEERWRRIWVWTP